MAAEITFGFTLSYAKTGYQSVSKSGSALSMDVSGGKVYSGDQNVGTSEETVNKGDLSNIGWVIVENNSANYLELFVTSSGTACARIYGGKKAVIPVYCTTLYAKANTAAVDATFTLIEQ